MNEPSIPLMCAEMLHVALSTVAHQIGSTTNYPVNNLESVLLAYRNSRDKQLMAEGCSRQQIASITEAAAEALVGWLEGKAKSSATAQADFDKWTKEMLGDNDCS